MSIRAFLKGKTVFRCGKTPYKIRFYINCSNFTPLFFLISLPINYFLNYFLTFYSYTRFGPKGHLFLRNFDDIQQFIMAQPQQNTLKKMVLPAMPAYFNHYVSALAPCADCFAILHLFWPHIGCIVAEIGV